MSTNKWLEENIEDGLRVQYGIDKILGSGVSEFQTVDLVDLKPFGRSLVIDGLMQSCRCDEFVYHECLVHPAMLLHPTGAKNVYIGGGGEGSTAREVLRHKSVEKCVMVDIDGVVVDFCKTHLEENKEAFADPRLQLVIDDAKAWIEKSDMNFDVIIMDLDDPLEGGPCYQLYTAEFYTMLKSKLNPGGIFVTQSGQSGIKQHHLVFSPIHNTLKSVFDNVTAYNQHVYSFLDEWGWNIALTEQQADAPSSLSVERVDQLIAERIDGELQFLDGQSWPGIWALSKKHRKTLAAETCVMSVAGNTHKFMHNPGVATVAEGKKAAPKKQGKNKDAKAEQKKKDDGKKGPAADAKTDPKKKLKAVLKEGGKRGVEIEGAADMGGLQFFCTSVDEPEGDIDLIVESLNAMNAKPVPGEEERKGCSGHVGKTIFSAGVDRLAVAAYVPEEKIGELSCEEWLKNTLSIFQGEIVSASPSLCTGFVKADGDKGIFPLKIREPMILEANNFLRKKGLFPEDNDSDDDEMVFGDDDFPS
jgi:thermospermine synthase